MRSPVFLLLFASLCCVPVRAMNLIADGEISHTAVANGAWTSSATWDAGVPDAGATVRIPAGIEVTYSGVAADAIRALRVDGVLQFSTAAVSELRLDTLEVAMGGHLQIGSVAEPVAATGDVRIIFTSGSDIDTGWDPDLLSRGLVAYGRVDIHGQRKTVHTKVATDPLAGDSTLQLVEAPQGWRVGDTLVLTGTRYSGWKWDNSIGAVRYHETQDEVVGIAAIDGATVTLDAPLQFNHVTPRADLKASVANFSRNITFRTDNGDSVPLHRRGHVMLMHHTAFDVRYAAFVQLGRTDKEVPSFDLDQLPSVEADSNVRGRYPLHFHMTGIEEPQAPAIALGNAVMHSPGWGYVHHASNATFHNNASFDTHGAGFVAETGDEIGAWTDNIAIKAKGNSALNPKNGNDVENFDMGRTGAGFWFQGRMVRTVGNVAASVNHGYAYLHRGTRMRGFPGSVFPMPEALPLRGLASPDDAPIRNFHDNEAFASTVGLYVVKANPNQGHDIHTHLSKFTAWEVRAGAAMEYTSHYLLEDFDIIGSTPEAFRDSLFGIEFGTNTTDMVINRASIADMELGVRLSKNFTDERPPEINQYVLIDVDFENVDELYEDLDPSVDRILDGGDLVPGRFEVVLEDGQPFEYLSPATSAGSGLFFDGMKTDEIGETPVAGGYDQLGIPSQDMIELCESDGYYRGSDGDPYAIVGEYFTERATGRIHKRGLKIRLGPEVEALLGSQFHAWSDAFERGPLNLASATPDASNDVADTDVEVDVVLDVLSNDSDPDGDALVVSGIVQPNHGLVFANDDDTLTYRPDFDFVGEDSFQYWASDEQGNYAPAVVTVRVALPGTTAGDLFDDGFELQ